MKRRLPNGWIETTLGEIAEWGSGGTPNRSVAEYFEGSIPWIKTGELNDNVIYETEEHISEKALKHSSAKIFPKGSIAIAMYGATIGKTAILGIDASTNQACGVAKPLKGINNKYLYYYLKSEKQNFIDQGKGGAQPNISQTIIKAHPFPLSPEDEQKRIAIKLDAIFGSIDVIKEKLNNIPDIIKQFKQSVLSEAIKGNLTEGWRKKNKKDNAYEFLVKLKNERLKKISNNPKVKLNKKEKNSANIEFCKHEKINTWARAKLDNLVYIAARIGWRGLKAEEYTVKGPLFLSVHSLNYGDYVNYDVAHHISYERYDESLEIALKENDILLCKDGAGIGKLGMVKNLTENATINSSLLLIRSLEAFHYKFLYYFFLGPELQNIVHERMTGSAIPHLFQRDIKEFLLEVPPMSEQVEIVRQIEQLFSLADSIQEKYDSLKNEIGTFPQSTLNKAFAGELIPQSKKDEPASKLLLRIRQTRNITTQKRK